MKTDTAHEAWNARWSSAEGREGWEEPDADVVAMTERLRKNRSRIRVLDLGCGVGRHTLMFARAGFETVAVDMAEAGLDELRRAAADEGLPLMAHAASMTDLPFPDDHFDYVLSFNVIYHGDGTVVRRVMDEIRRVLKPGGIYQGTMLSKRNDGFGIGDEIAPNTFVSEPAPDDVGSDKGHPHFYCNAAELIALLDGFEILSLQDREQRRPGHWHWHLAAERLA
jgi:tellurite methyltransferase